MFKIALEDFLTLLLKELCSKYCFTGYPYVRFYILRCQLCSNRFSVVFGISGGKVLVSFDSLDSWVNFTKRFNFDFVFSFESYYSSFTGKSGVVVSQTSDYAIVDYSFPRVDGSKDRLHFVFKYPLKLSDLINAVSQNKHCLKKDGKVCEGVQFKNSYFPRGFSSNSNNDSLAGNMLRGWIGYDFDGSLHSGIADIVRVKEVYMVFSDKEDFKNLLSYLVDLANQSVENEIKKVLISILEVINGNKPKGDINKS